MSGETTTGTLRRTPLYGEHLRLGARMVPFAGWEMPVQYAGIGAEHAAVRTAAGLFDVSHMGELELTGPGALGLVDRLVTNDLGRVADGQAMYTCCCNIINKFSVIAVGGINNLLSGFYQRLKALYVVGKYVLSIPIGMHERTGSPDYIIMNHYNRGFALG